MNKTRQYRPGDTKIPAEDLNAWDKTRQELQDAVSLGDDTTAKGQFLGGTERCKNTSGDRIPEYAFVEIVADPGGYTPEVQEYDSADPKSGVYGISLQAMKDGATAKIAFTGGPWRLKTEGTDWSDPDAGEIVGPGSDLEVIRGEKDGVSLVRFAQTGKVWAKLDADNGDGTYNATEQEWDADNDQWTDKTNGRVWEAGNSDNLDALIEESGLTGLVGRVVQTYKLNGDWVFKEGMNYVWEATADASSGTITAKRVNADGSLATPEKTFDTLPE